MYGNPNTTVPEAIARLRRLVETLPAELREISEVEASQLRANGGWSRKQILGHVIDSATVNHQRFVRAQMESGFSFLYDQERWVEVNDYQNRPWAELIETWTVLNRHLLRVIERIPPALYDNLCGHGDGHDDDRPWTLAFRIPDYVHHLEHHLKQIREP